MTANNAPVDDSFPHWLGSEWDPGDRAARVIDLLAGIPKVTTEDMRTIQLDTYVRRADEVMPALQAIGPTPQTEDGRLLWQRMLAWDRQCGIESVGCAAYITVEQALVRAIFDDELGPLAREYVGSTFSWRALVDVLGDRAKPWWLVTTPGAAPTADPAGLATATVDESARLLRAAYGDPQNWTWGRLHQVTFKEGTLGSSGIPPLEWYFNPPGRPVAGADGAINNNYYRISRAYPDPDEPGSTGVGLDRLFEVSNGPSYRFTIDMADLDGARIMITTGQSGNPFHPHYGDLIPMWVAGETLALPFSPANVAGSAVETLTLSPP